MHVYFKNLRVIVLGFIIIHFALYKSDIFPSAISEHKQSENIKNVRILKLIENIKSSKSINT